jgi:hypothetical protein
VTLLLNGCWALSLPDKRPEGFVEEDVLQSLIGRDRDEVLETLGIPVHVGYKEEKTYYSYETTRDDKGMLMFFHIPLLIPVDGSEAHCILLEFNGANLMQRYEIVSSGINPVSSGPDSCVKIGSASDKEIRWNLHRLERLDSAEAQMALYWSGHEPSRLYWLCHAADQGHTVAQYELGLLYRDGSGGVRQDSVLAYMWFRLASLNEHYHATATYAAQALLKNLTARQAKEAEVLFKQWQPGVVVHRIFVPPILP